MADDTERLVVALEARIRDFERNMAKASATAGRSYDRMRRGSTTATRQMEGDMARVTTRINQALESTSARIGAFRAAFAAGFVSVSALKSAQQLIDASTRIENALKVAGLSGKELTEVYDGLFAAAQDNAAPLESLVTLYGRLSLVQKELNVSQDELIGFSRNIALALRVSGQSAEESSGALLQLSQALGGGIVRAEEFNSVLDGAPTIAQAAAAGLEEAGGSVARLRNLVIDGKVSSEAFFRAFEAGAVTLQEKVAASEMTVSQQFVRLQNALTDTAGKIDEATGASGRLSGAIEDLASTVQQFGSVIVTVAESDVGTFVGSIADAYGEVSELIRIMGGLPGVFAKVSQMNVDIMNGKQLGTTMSEDAIQSRIDQAFDNPAAPKGGRLPASNERAALPAVQPVSLKDYPVNTDASANSTAGARARSAGAASADRERESVEKLVAEMRQELSLVGASDQAKRAAEVTRRAGAAATQAERQQIVALNEAIYQQEEAQRRAADAAEYFRNIAGDAISDLIPKIRTGNDAIDKLVNSLVEAVAQAALLGKGPIAGLFGGGLGGLSGLFGGSGIASAFVGRVGMFAGGTDFAPGGAAIVGEKGPELVNLPRGSQVVPNHRLSAAMGQPQPVDVGVSVTLGWSKSADGNLRPFIEQVSQNVSLAEIRRAAPNIVSESVRNAEKTTLGKMRQNQLRGTRP